ncbi:MAG: tetratricopeptide repeat protein [Gammaproteobacteria bacterium]|nr:tetratricopeptide repeat protein [Gammaproteobacteria bacterium]
MENQTDNFNYVFSTYLIDVAKRELLSNGVEVPIQARVLDLLIYLLENRDRVVDRNELFEAIWPDMAVTDAAIARAIMKVRKAVGDDASQQAIIKTLHGHGYRFVAEVKTVDAPETEQVQIPGQAALSVFRQPGNYRKLAFQLIVVFLAILLGTVYLNSWRSAKTVTESQYPPNSIAVLPFVNTSVDPANEYLSDGISEELLHLLAKIPKLRVVSSSSSFSFKGKNLDIPTIAEQLNVAYVLNGSVRRSGNTIRVTAQLIDVSNDSHLWSETYDRTLEDIFAVQDEIARIVVGKLEVTLLTDTPTIRKTNPGAYTLYLQARHLGTQFTIAAFTQSNKLYEQALTIDPNFAAAWSGLAANYINQTLTGHRSTDDGIKRARDAAHRSLALDPEQATALAHLSRVALRFDRDLGTAARYLQQAWALEPTNPDILRHVATLDRSLGRLSEAIAVNKYVIERDPVNPASHYFLGFSYLLDRRLDEAVSSFYNALMLSPDHVSAHYRIGVALYYKGEQSAALAEMQQERGVTKKLMGAVMIHHALGQTDASDSALTELIDKYAQTTAYNIAYLLAFRGENDRAFEWLDNAVRYNDPGLAQIAYQVEFTGIHGDPRWLPFLKSIGMAPEQLEVIEFKVTLPE